HIRRSGCEGAWFEERNSAGGIFSDADGRNACRGCGRFRRTAVLRCKCKNQSGARWRFSGGVAGRLFRRLCLRGAGKRSSSLLVWTVVASSGGSDFQGFCAGAAFRGFARQASEKRFAQHERAPMNVAIIDYGAGNVPSVERAFWKLGANA